VPPVVNWDSTQPPPAVCPPETTINPSEIAVLSALRQRAASLDARDAALDRKQALIDAAEKSLTGQLAGLQAVEDHLNALSQNQSAADEARWQALVATYEAMDPQAAAGIFDGLDLNVLLPVLTRMNSRKSAPILADMSPDKARQATELMAGQGQDITLGTPLPPATGQ
jgi:flagellar motility protein MotE (MotC chaperone)